MAIEALGPRMMRAAETSGIAHLQKVVGPSLLARSVAKAPVLFGDLKASAFQEDLPRGVRVGFGRGAAGGYVVLIHESDLFRHSGARDYKWVYYYEGGLSRAIKPGDWNEPNIPPNFRRLFGRPLEWEGRGENPWVRAYESEFGSAAPSATGDHWRFSIVSYAKRADASGYPLSGQAHFLFGRADSAYEESRDWIDSSMAAAMRRASIDEVSRVAAEMRVGGGANV